MNNSIVIQQFKISQIVGLPIPQLNEYNVTAEKLRNNLLYSHIEILTRTTKKRTVAKLYSKRNAKMEQIMKSTLLNQLKSLLA